MNKRKFNCPNCDNEIDRRGTKHRRINAGRRSRKGRRTDDIVNKIRRKKQRREKVE